MLYFLERLQAQAAAAGGALHVLNGNHETMNVMGNHRWVLCRRPIAAAAAAAATQANRLKRASRR